METDHMQPVDEGGRDDIDNAIPVCFECHAEIHSYNVRHPRGRRFQPAELRFHKEQWLAICRDRPDVLVAASRQIDVGPIQALLDELEFNDAVARRPSTDEQGCEFRDDQFRRAIQAGSIAMLPDDVKRAVVDAYVAMGGANNTIRAAWQHPRGGNPWALSVNEAGRRIRDAQHLVTVARERLLAFLRPESDAEVRGAEPVIADRDEAQR
jgi:hypothetical protein